ncbi:hypothetical protein [Chlorogloeopsis fritschii]|uniref:hypothetical protein n=1 Tax=Chlorogloeopsis fritschii TaxID=1124 RepID=UPI003C6CC49F
MLDGGDDTDVIFGGSGDDQINGDKTTSTSTSASGKNDFLFGDDGHDHNLCFELSLQKVSD